MPDDGHLRQAITLPIEAGDPYTFQAEAVVPASVQVTAARLLVKRESRSIGTLVDIQGEVGEAPDPQDGERVWPITFKLARRHTRAIGTRTRSWKATVTYGGGPLTFAAGKISCSIQELTG